MWQWINVYWDEGGDRYLQVVLLKHNIECQGLKKINYLTVDRKMGGEILGIVNIYPLYYKEKRVLMVLERI